MRLKLSAWLVVYLAVTFTYSTWLKHIAILEMLMVAAGFLLRTVTGAAATHVTLSRWFLIVAGFGSLYMVVGKRYAEATGLGENAAPVQATGWRCFGAAAALLARAVTGLTGHTYLLVALGGLLRSASLRS